MVLNDTKTTGDTIAASEWNESATAVNAVVDGTSTHIASKLENVVEDTTPQLGGNLDGQTNEITNISRMEVGDGATTSVVVDNASTPLSASSSVMVARTDGGGTGEFANSGQLVLQPRGSTVGRGIIFLNGDGTSNVKIEDGGNTLFYKTATFDEEFDNGNSSTADTIDFGTGNIQKSTLTGNVTFTFTAPGGVGRFSLKLIQDATGSRSVTWPATVKWAGGTAPTLSTAAGSEDIITFIYDGTNYYGVASLDFS